MSSALPSLYDALDVDGYSEDPYAAAAAHRLSTASGSGNRFASPAAAAAAAAGGTTTPSGVGQPPSPYHTPALSSVGGRPSVTAAATTPPVSGAEPFATPGNVAECLAFLQPSLEALGVRARLPDGAAAASDPQAALAAALNAAYELSRLLARANERRERQEELLAKLRVDARTADKEAQRLQGRSESQSQEAAGLKIKLRQLDAWYRAEVERWAAERASLTRRASQLEQRHAQFEHELRRRDVDYERLQSRLRATLMRSGGGGAAGGGGGAGGGAAGAGEGGSIAVGSSGDAAAAEREDPLQLSQLGGQRPRSGTRNSSGGGGLSAGMMPASRPSPSPQQQQQQQPSSSAWHEVTAKLAALRVRTQQCASAPDDIPAAAADHGGDSLAALAQQAETPHERLLVAKLIEARSMIAEQEQTLKLAVGAFSRGGRSAGGGVGGGSGGSGAGDRLF